MKFLYQLHLSLSNYTHGVHYPYTNVSTSCIRPSSWLLHLKEYLGGGGCWWRRQGWYATWLLQETASYIEVRPLNMLLTAHTYRLPVYIPRSHVNIAFFVSFFNHHCQIFTVRTELPDWWVTAGWQKWTVPQILAITVAKRKAKPAITEWA
jgi:hypothetical protein